MTHFHRLLVSGLAIAAVATSATADARVPADEHGSRQVTPLAGDPGVPRTLVSVWSTSSRPCHHHLLVDARTGDPAGPITTYGARCIA